eukprot:scaffold62307_cov36-Phaeocystis_antarctica.AAC.1
MRVSPPLGLEEDYYYYWHLLLLYSPPLGLEEDRLAVKGRGLLALADGRHRLDGDAEVDVLPGGDAAQRAACVVLRVDDAHLVRVRVGVRVGVK